jgi:shikimate kinase
MRPVALIGLRCAGKSSVGRALARLLGWTFVDLDEALAELDGRGRSAGDLLAELGEPDFRALEARALSAVLEPGAELVLATGGGAVLRAENRALLARRCRCVWLEAPLSVLATRLQQDSARRPSLTGLDASAELELLAAERRAHYEELAELVLDSSSADAEALASELAARLVD